jgi:hypothetical protein
MEYRADAASLRSDAQTYKGRSAHSSMSAACAAASSRAKERASANSKNEGRARAPRRSASSCPPPHRSRYSGDFYPVAPPCCRARPNMAAPHTLRRNREAEGRRRLTQRERCPSHGLYRESLGRKLGDEKQDDQRGPKYRRQKLGQPKGDDIGGRDDPMVCQIAGRRCGFSRMQLEPVVEIPIQHICQVNCRPGEEPRPGLPRGLISRRRGRG